MPSVAQWQGTPSVKGPTESIRMALLTASLIGLQFTWNVEMTYCTPYLLELGLTKSKISLVWVAGPLSGLIMQPVVGVVADRCTSRWGRRRPFMFFGTILVALFLLLLGWTKEVVRYFVADEAAAKNANVYVAVFSIYGIDFAINAVQGSCRGLIVDTLPMEKQQMGSSWASRMVAVGSLIGYAAGAVDLRAIFGPMLGDTQFKQLTGVAALTLCLAIATTSWAVTERVLISDGSAKGLDIKQVVSTIAHTALNLPRSIQAICTVQFWAWIGWFPFLFYSTTWVGEVYLRYDAPAEVRAAGDLTGKVGRTGSTALVSFSIVTFAMSVLLPFFVENPDEGRGEKGPSFSHMAKPKFGASAWDKYKPSLLTTWMTAHCIFAGSMSMAPFVTSMRHATIIIAFCGVSWAVASWAPWALIGVEINRLNMATSHSSHPKRASSMDLFSEAQDRLEKANTGGAAASTSSGSRGGGGGGGASSGQYLGIMNLYTTLPQFMGTAISWVVFSILEPGKSPELSEAPPEEHHGTDGPNAIAVCLFIGACSACLAVVATLRLGRIQGKR